MIRYLGIKHHSSIGGFLPVVVAVLAAFGSARADDFSPPPWDRGHPFAMTAEWEFLSNASPAGPDGLLTDLAGGGGLGVTQATFFPAPAWVWETGDGDGQWRTFNGSDIMIDMDNVIDLEPVKEIWIQFTFSPGQGVPTVTDVSGVKGLIGVSSQLVEKDADGQYAWEHWQMFPNPDWETIFVHVPAGVAIDQIVIDTISTIPEPSTLAMIVSGSLGLAAWLWRRRRTAI